MWVLLCAAAGTFSANRARTIVLAQGNSGTHSVFQALCAVGAPAVHFKLECNPGAPNASGGLQVVSRLHTASPSRATGHDRLMSLWAVATGRCARASCNVTVVDWIKAVVRTLDEIAAHGVHSLTDTPYAHFPGVLASTAFARARAIFIARNHTEWALSRRAEQSESVLCHPRLWLSSRSNASDPLDLLQCAEACLLSRPPKSRGGLRIRGAGCFATESSNPVATVARAHALNEAHVVALFGERVSRLPLFTQATRMVSADIASWIAQQPTTAIRDTTRTPLRLVLVAVAKGESPYIREWLAYHQAIGIRDFVLIPNECDPAADRAFRAAIAPVLTAGVSVLNAHACQHPVQGPGYAAAVWHLLRERPALDPSRYRVAFYDVDEFLVVKETEARSVGTLLDALPRTADVWNLPAVAFGSSDRARRPAIGGVTANYVLRAAVLGETGHEESHGEIRAAKPPHEKGRPTPHIPHPIAAPYFTKAVCHLSSLAKHSRYSLASAYIEQPHQMMGNAAHYCLPNGTYTWHKVSPNILRLNHYTSKSEEEWAVKKSRTQADNNALTGSRSGAVPASYSSVVDVDAWATVRAACEREPTPLCTSLTALDHVAFPARAARLLRAYCDHLASSPNAMTPLDAYRSAACRQFASAEETAASTASDDDSILSDLAAQGHE